MNRILAFSLIFLLPSSFSQAAVTMYVYQDGADVVASAGGSLNIDDLTVRTTGVTSIGGAISGSAAPNPDRLGLTQLGPAGSLTSNYSIETTAAWSTGGDFFASTNSGDNIGVFSFLDEDSIDVPDGYATGDYISATSTWNNQTITGMGLIPGTYVFT